MNDHPTTATRPTSPDDVAPHIVGIGASAGGLEAIEQFLAAVPDASGLAFVVVQHLDPTRKDMLVELLGRTTSMPVEQVSDRVEIKPNHVYVIPPGTDLSVLEGRLHLMNPTEPRGLRLPIDVFLRSLALDQRASSVAVILSGTGSDGTLGIRAIKEHGGSVFVQDPDLARFDGMPRSAIATGVVDVVDAPGELPAKIINLLRRTPARDELEIDLAAPERDGMEKLVILLRTRTGRDFSHYKMSTIYRRVQRRMGLQQLATVSEYVQYLRNNPPEIDLLFRELLIGVTSFFRDADTWDQLRDEVFPRLIAEHPGGGVIRAWVPGCSTGEEAYSLAIAFREAMDRARVAHRCSLQIFATDLDVSAIERARVGTYPRNIAADVSEARLNRFFVDDDLGYRVNTELREMVVFAEQDVTMDPPFTKLDLLSCRNLLIYFDAELQQRTIRIFHYALNNNGVLLLGNAETCDAAPGLFEPVPGASRLFTRLSGAADTRGLDLGAGIGMPARVGETALIDRRTSPPDLQKLVTELMVRRFAPAAVLTNAAGDILFISGKAGAFLEPAMGKANMNIFNMAHTELVEPLHDTIHTSLRGAGAAVARDVQVVTRGGSLGVDVIVEQLTDPDELSGLLLIAFVEVPVAASTSADTGKPPAHGRAASERHARSVDQIQHARDQLQVTRERMQSMQEELRSANEELQSTNEELQSTNEELSTSKEEMQSMNEELRTVNFELQSKVNELSQASDDMKNLLDSTDIAILFLDPELRIRRYTAQATTLFRLQASDVGRPITDLTTDLLTPILAKDVATVFRTLVPAGREATTADGRWYAIRIMPYRTQDNRIDGAVITFADVTESKRLEMQLRATSSPDGDHQERPAHAGEAADE